MSQHHSKALAALALGIAVVVGGLVLTRHVVAVAGEADASRLNRSILAYIAEKNPQAPIGAFQRFPEVLVNESQRTGLDHCLAIAQAEIESQFRHDAVGNAGEIGIFQVLPSTAALFEGQLGPFRRPVLNKNPRELGDLADPIVSTKFAMAYLRDIRVRKPSVRDALTEYNGGPAGRHPHYYRLVMGTYVEVLERQELKCRYRATPKELPGMMFLTRA
jgi:soluble lytic murein transglycosylase-like protein